MWVDFTSCGASGQIMLNAQPTSLVLDPAKHLMSKEDFG